MLRMVDRRGHLAHDRDRHIDHRSELLNAQRVTISPGPVPEPPGSGGTAGAGEAGASSWGSIQEPVYSFMIGYVAPEAWI
jgi:hypothetical protein